MTTMPRLRPKPMNVETNKKAGLGRPAIDLDHDDNDAAPAAHANEMSRQRKSGPGPARDRP
jgi:hypothetical protein